MLWADLGPVGRSHETRTARENTRFENQPFQNQHISLQSAKGQLILPQFKENSPDGGSLLSPLTVLTPSKPRLVLARIVGIKTDVQARYSAISKLEDVAETAASPFSEISKLPYLPGAPQIFHDPAQKGSRREVEAGARECPLGILGQGTHRGHINLFLAVPRTPSSASVFL